MFWLPKEDLNQYELADDFIEMIPIFEDDQLTEFYYHREDDEWEYEII